MSLLDVGKNLFNSGKKAATDFLTQYPTPASYIQAKANPVISPVPQTQQITPQDNRGIWATPFGRGMVQAQNFIQSPRSSAELFNWKQAPIPQAVQKMPVLGPLVNARKNIYQAATTIPLALAKDVVGRGVLDPALDIGRLIGNQLTGQNVPNYQDVKSPAVRLAYNGMGIQENPKQVIGNIAGMLVPAASVYGGGKIFGLGKTAVEQAVIKGFKETVGSAMKTGGIYGTGYGLLESLSNNRDIEDTSKYLFNILGETATYGAGGAALAGGFSAGSYITGKVIGTAFNYFKEQGLSDKEAAGKVRTYVRGAFGRFKEKIEVAGESVGKLKKRIDNIPYNDPNDPTIKTLGEWNKKHGQTGAIDFNAKVGGKPSQTDIQSTYGKLIAEGNPKRIAAFEKKYFPEATASRTQSSKAPQVGQIKSSTKPIQQPISNKPLSTSALPKSIPLTSKSTSQQVAASLPSRVDDFVQKTLGYSTKDPTGGTRKASLWTRTLRKGEEAFTSNVEKGLGSENALVRNAASTLQNFFRGAGMSTERSQASMGLRGEMAVGTERAYNAMESLYKSLGNDKKSLERINAVLDPSISKIKVNFNQLTPTEKQVYGIIREGLDIVHDTSYANGHITPEMYAKNKGKYTPRMYEAMELPPEVNKFISQGKKIVNDLYKKRGDITDWKVENSLNDPVYALGKRLAQVETNNAVKKYVGYLASNPQFVSDVEKAGFVKLSDSPAYGQLKGKYVLNSAAEDLKGFFFANEGLDKLYDVFRIYDRLPIRQLQKKLLTVFNPTTNVGNIVSDQIFGFVSGVDSFTLNKNLLRLKNNPSEFKQLSDYLMRKGIVGTDITKTDFVNRMGQIDSLASGNKKGVFTRISDKVQSFYGGTDDAYKISALKSLLEKGFTIEEATRKVADGFQNYANVGKFYDVWSKTPVVGSAFIKFQGDLMRIIKNGAVNNPLGLITFLGTLAGVARLSSKLSGESDSDRVARENRFAAPMIPGLNIPLTWQTPMGEINVARYISPFFANNEVTNLSKMLPFVPNINPKKDMATNIALNTNDPLTATPVQLLVNRDFRGKNIADPKENKYQPSTLTPQERLKNQAIFAGRGYTPPPINSAIDVYSASQGKENMYGAKQSVPQAVARMAGIKIQKYGPEEVAKAKETNDKFQESKNEALDRQINAVYKQQLKDEISPDQVKNRVNYLESQKVDSTGKSGNKEDIFRYLDTKGNMQSIDMNFQPAPPEKTGLAELDKKAISKFNGEITSKANDIYTLYKEGKLTEDEANTQLSELKTLKSKYSTGTKKAPKITVKKVKIPKAKIVKSKPMKITNFKIKSPSMPKAKKSTAFKIKKMKPIKLAKLTIKSKTV